LAGTKYNIKDVRYEKACLFCGMRDFFLRAFQCAGQTRSTALKAAKKSAGASTHVTISVDEPFTQEMADRAGLNPNKPDLSSDGVQSGENLASSECLLAETLIMKTNGFRTDEELQEFCNAAKEAKTAEKVDAVKSSLEEHSGTRIDDALIHIVSWKNGKANGSWYQYNRHADGWSGKLVPFASGDAVSSIDHLLGHSNVAFLAIHLGIDGSCGISYDIKAEQVTPLNQQDLSDLIKLATDYLTKSTVGKTGTAGTTGTSFNKLGLKGTETGLLFNVPGESPQIGVWGGETILQLPSLPTSITLTPTINKSVSAKPADKSKNVKTFQLSTTCSNKDAGQHSIGGEARATNGTSLTRSWKANFVHWTPLSFHPKVQSLGVSGVAAANTDSPASKDPLSGMGQTVVNEGIYWWDVSVAMQVSSYKNLKFDSQNNLIVLKKTDDIKPYALLDFYPGELTCALKTEYQCWDYSLVFRWGTSLCRDLLWAVVSRLVSNLSAFSR